MSVPSAADRLRSVKRALDAPSQNAGQLAGVASNLHSVFLSKEESLLEDASGLADELVKRVEALQPIDLLAKQTAYAERLASAPGDLIYEEVHKLFSLCDEIHALQAFGFEVDEAALAAAREAVTERLRTQKRVARLVAEDRFEPPFETRWWYKIAKESG